MASQHDESAEVEEWPWWHTEKILPFRRAVHKLETPELRAITEEIKGSVISLQTRIETETYELQMVRELARELGPALAFDADRFAETLAGRYSIAVEDAHELIETFDWWMRARKALGYMKEKQGIVQGEIARRRVADAEQTIFDIKGKISRAAYLLNEMKSKSVTVAEVRKLVNDAKEHLDKVGP